MGNQPLLRLGTSSWSSADWKGIFYSKHAKSSDFIAEYAQKFPAVEIDATFYSIPSVTMAQGWRDRTPEDFIFAAKAPQAITHEKFMVDCGEEVSRFLSVMAILGPRLGPILFQFPYYAKAVGVTVENFIERLGPFLESLPLKEFKFAVEVRNKTWIAPPLLDLLSKHKVPLALIDHPWMHRPDKLFSIEGIITGPFAYIRWLGDRKAIEEVTTTWNQTIVDRRHDLEGWVAPVRALVEKRVPVYGFFNNHYTGYAPAAVELFAGMVK